MAFGIIDGMELRIDKAGRIVLPKPLRERLGYKPDTALEVDGLWVHQGTPEPEANWDRVLIDVREERIDSVLKA